MSAEQSRVIPQQPARALPAMQVLIVARVEKLRRHEGKTYTRVLVPAPDAFSRPTPLEIRSKQRLGEPGEDVRVVCTVGGYSRKPYQFTDRTTGETRKVEPVEITLDAVE
jgi:hypothetical protein